MSKHDQHHDWLALIEISGPFLAVPVLKEAFSVGLEELDGVKRKRLRQAYEEWREALEADDPQFAELHTAWIEEVLSRGLEFDEDGKGDVLKRANWCAANLNVSLPEHGVTLAPDFAVIDEQRGNKPLMFVHTYGQGIDLEASLKVDRWTVTPAERMVQLCRSSGCRLGLVTNGERWMLVDAPVGAVTSFASWYSRIWSQEPITLQAFVHLLGIRRFFADEAEQLPALFDRSLKYQDEVTDALGEQVRRAVEVLIQALDKADQDRDRELLRDVTEPVLYEAALTVMMRLVFLLSAEERGLLLLGDERYEANYALSTLRMQLRTDSEEILERRWDAWSRLLAVFRAVFGGIEHENLRLPALGGSLFDPDRFPFLEGRAKGSDWRTDTAKPLPIDNRTVLLLLDAIQQFEGRTLSYRALDVEQIGYVYEGLLERTVERTTEVTLELDGTKNAKAPWIKLAELESAQLDGEEPLAKLLQERSGSSASRVRNDLSKPVDGTLADRLLAACHGNTALRERIKPYARLVRTDPWGYPLVYPAGAFVVTTGSDRRETGTHYTPKSLTEAIVTETLTPVVYTGPAEGTPREQWLLKSPAELLNLKICDPAMGSGAFLVQVCRWLADRLVEAWFLAESAGKKVSADGVVLHEPNTMEPLPSDSEARTVTARRLIAERCLYGVDLNPLAVELAKLSIWLVTLAKGRPFGFLDHNLRCGDSLLGIYRLDQLTELSMVPTGTGQLRLFGQNIKQAVREALELRQRLRELPIRDIRDVEVIARLDSDVRRKLEAPERIADAFIGEVFASGGNSKILEDAAASLAIQAGRVVDGHSDAITSVSQRAITALAADSPAGKLGRNPFHWPLEFPEVFNGENPGFDCIVGNPPFLGGKRITGVAGTAFRDWLVFWIADGRRGSADLVAYFFLRAWNLVRVDGGFGLLAVNTISEGDTRQVGLEAMVQAGAVIHAAYPNEPWPGSAAVVTSRVHVHKGRWLGARNLTGRTASFISAFLSDQDEWSPRRLKSDEGSAFTGSFVLGMGFVLTEDTARRMLEAEPKNADVIFPYLNGEDLNTHPKQRASRFVISFWDWPEERAKQYRMPYEWIEKRVKPQRQRRNKDGTFALRRPLPERWWQYADKRPALYHAIGRGFHFEQHPNAWKAEQYPFEKVIVCGLVAKHLMISLVDNNQIFAHKLAVFASDRCDLWALLSTSIHEIWARKNSSTLGYGLNYSPTDAFETFPMTLSTSPSLGTLGDSYASARSQLMETAGIGLTKLMNRLNDPTDMNPLVVTLRDLQQNVDIAALREYGWDDINPGHGFYEMPYLPEGDRVRFAFSQPARIEILRRLTALNRKRFQDEVDAGLHCGKTTGGTARAPRSRNKRPEATSQPSFDLSGTAAKPGQDPMAVVPDRNFTLGPATAILAFLKSHPVWHSKSEILIAMGAPDDQWNSALKELLANGTIQRQGEKHGARYRAVFEGGKQ